MNILDILENAEYNLENIPRLGQALFPLVKEQLHTALTLLQKGYDAETDVSTLLKQFENVSAIPDAD